MLDDSLARSLRRKRNSKARIPDFTEKLLLSAHFKILDIAKPLIHLWTNQDRADQAMRAVESALRPWSVAFREMTRACRRNIDR